MADAFISYQRNPSASQALLIQTKLQYVHQIDAYVDTTRTDSTRVQFPDRLMQAIADAPTFILLLGDTTLESEWVRKEIQRAYELKKHCIPIFQESYKPSVNNDPAIDYVLSFDGEHLFDRKNIHINESIANIANLVMRTSETPPPIVSLPILNTPPKPKIILPQPFDWCYVPAGKVTLTPDAVDSKIYIKKNVTIDLPEFWISKYPITNKQYQGFLDDFDFHYNETISNGRLIPAFALDSHYINKDNSPVMVSYYSATFFCKWLSAKIQSNVILPTDGQWQRAAQGDEELVYPWGNYFNESLANSAVNGLGKVTPVNYYENRGDSPFGLSDMVGNIWEWCATAYNTGENYSISPQHYIVHGGSYIDSNINNLTNTRRAGFPSDNKGFAFRLVVSI